MRQNLEKIKSWSQFVEIASRKRYKQFIYRGHTKQEHELKSSLQRAFERLNVRRDWKKGREASIIKSFKSRAHLYLHHQPERSKTLEWLSVMQHYGAPTRLLDWTYSPFVAAFFALEGLNEGSTVFEIDLQSLANENERMGISVRGGQMEKIFTREFKQNFVFPFEPDYQNERLILQQGLFLVPSTVEASIESILATYKNYKFFQTRYVFEMSEAKLRGGIKKLKAMNIDNFRLFPGIEGLSRAMYLQLLEPISTF
jgi:hypothetical protein